MVWSGSVIRRTRRPGRRGAAIAAARARSLLLLLCLPIFAACAVAPAGHLPDAVRIAEPAYDYPIDNPWVATVLGTPLVDRLDLPEPPPRLRERVLRTAIADRRPEGFWYHRGLNYTLLRQPGAAALVFVIAGTGASNRSGHTIWLGRLLHAAGLHVVLLPSPTHANFIVTASSSHLPGRPVSDAADLHRVMRMIRADLADELDMSGFHLTGYSMGALHAAFVARLDERERTFDFERVLLINPPYSLYGSMQVIDAMLTRNLPGGIDNLGTFLDEAVTRIASAVRGSDALDFRDADLLFDLYEELRPDDDRLAATIGLTFRLAAANMIFTADVMSGAGYIYPANQPFLSRISLDEYFAVALRTGFPDYFRDMYAEYYLARSPDLSPAALAAQSSLESIGDWLRNSPRIGLLTNLDDVILSAGDLDALRRLFPGRARIYPSGGHMGNLEHRAVSAYIARYFQP